MNQTIKNIIGGLLGYAKCSITDRTLWRESTITIWYMPNKGYFASQEALRGYSPETIISLIKQIIQPTLSDLEIIKEHPKFEPFIKIHSPYLRGELIWKDGKWSVD